MSTWRPFRFNTSSEFSTHFSQITASILYYLSLLAIFTFILANIVSYYDNKNSYRSEFVVLFFAFFILTPLNVIFLGLTKGKERGLIYVSVFGTFALFSLYYYLVLL